MFCQKCGNQLNEGAAFCPKCGTRIDVPSGIRVGAVNGNKVKPLEPVNPQKTKKSKKNLIFWIVVFCAVVYAGIHIRNAIRTKNPITAERFVTVMESKGYTVRDETDNYADDRQIFKCYAASVDDYDGCVIRFFELYSDSEAKDRFDSAITEHKRHAENYSKSSVYEESGKNYSIYSDYLISPSNILYQCYVRVDNVYIFAADIDGQKMSDIMKDMESLGLGDWR